MEARKDEQEVKTHRFLFEGFKSKDEFEEALRNLERYLATLKKWDARTRIVREVPPRTLN